MAKLVADRLLWAVETMALDPSDCVLEIGCGNGAAVSLICRNLSSGTVTAIDRSKKMIHAAEKLNARCIAEGKASFVAASFHEVDWGDNRFNKIFAFNVNLFWMKPARELEIIKERLLPGGEIYIFNQPPAADKIRHIAECTKVNLIDAGFSVKSIIFGDQKPVSAVCVIGGF